MRRSGFTLVELLISMAVASVVIIGITGTFLAQARQYQAHASRRAVQASSRMGLSFLERTIRAAGYGVDPDRVVLAYDGFNISSPTTANLNYPDAITVHSRDTNFQRQLTSVTPTNIIFSGALTEPLYKGQILLLMCLGGQTYAYVTVATTVPVTGGSPVNVALSVSPAIESPTSSPGARFHPAQGGYNGAAPDLTKSCFDTGWVMKINRTSFYVAAFDDDGNAQSPLVPYLMMHRGLDTNLDVTVDASDAVPIAMGIEQLQIAYVLQQQGNAVPTLLGVQDGGAVPGWGSAWASATTPVDWVDAPYNDVTRTVSHPANVRQIRLSLVARSNLTDSQSPGDDLFNPGQSWNSETLTTSGVVAWQQMENLGATPPTEFLPTGRGYGRTALRVSVTPKNLLMRSQFLPPGSGG
jgi:type IV pilus assembly protein PilW